jgi:hypothetical protein
MPINKTEVASINQYTETILPSGELHITGRFDGQQMAQTLPYRVPCIIMYDPELKNLMAVQDVANDIRPGMKFVSIITEISAGAKQN